MNYQRGQVGIVVLLVTLVMLTIGVSVVSRTTSDISTSTSNQAASQALDAAESGIEDAFSQDLDTLPQDTQIPLTVSENLDVAYTVSRLNILETTTEEFQSAVVNVLGAPAGKVLYIDWAKETNCGSENLASLVVLVYKSVGSSPGVRRIYASACDHADGFAVGATISANGYHRRVTIPLETNDSIVRIRPVYNQTAFRVYTDGSWSLPTQQYTVRSVAKNSTSGETKAVQVDRGLPIAPNVLEYALYSGTSIIQ